MDYKVDIRQEDQVDPSATVCHIDELNVAKPHFPQLVNQSTVSTISSAIGEELKQYDYVKFDEYYRVSTVKQ